MSLCSSFPSLDSDTNPRKKRGKRGHREENCVKEDDVIDVIDVSRSSKFFSKKLREFDVESQSFILNSPKSIL